LGAKIMIFNKEDLEKAKENPDIIYTELKTWSKQEGNDNDGGFIISYGIKDFGFGELTFFTKDDKVFCDSEGTSKELCRKILNKFFDNCELK
jgi:hypothetical protein